MPILISLSSVNKIYNTGGEEFYALNNITLDIFQGEFLAIVGPSGSGKSTLLNIIGGMDRPTIGRVIYKDGDLAHATEKELTAYRRSEVGFVFQFYNLISTLTAKENVEVATEIAASPMEASLALSQVDLRIKSEHFPAQLSGGQQQRIAIARAIAGNPTMLLCDEPTGSVDSTTGAQIIKLLLDLCRRVDKTVVMITHDREIAKVANRIIEIKYGKIVSIETQRKPMRVDDLEW